MDVLRHAKSIVTAVLAAALISTLVSSPGSAASNKSDRVAVLHPMMVLNGDESGINWDDPHNQATVDAVSKLKPKKVRLDGSLTFAEQEALITEAGESAVIQWQTELDQQAGDSTVNKTQRIYGDCGWSEITLQDAFGTYVAYAQARFSINRPGYAYRVNVHVWDTYWGDFSTWDFPDTGTLNGGRSYSDDFTFRVDESGQKYGAKLNRGEVYVGGNNWCYTGVPTVDSVTIF